MMDRLIGDNVDVHLKFDEVMTGILIDTDENHIYVQNNVGIMITIPRENVKYYISNNIGGNNIVSSSQQTVAAPQPSPESKISVWVDDNCVAEVPVPDDMDISSCNNQLLERVWANELVVSALRNKTQLMLAYTPGEVRITTTEGAKTGPQSVPPADNSFSMTQENPTVSPLEFFKNLNKDGNNQ